MTGDSVFRFAIWDLGDSLASLEELCEKLPALPEGHHWIANEAGERFGIVSFGEPPPAEALEEARRLIGKGAGRGRGVRRPRALVSPSQRS